jgi:hypothetical protein
MGVRRIRLANLPPEVSDRMIRGALSPYGEVAAIHEDSWSSTYRYPVLNGVRIAVTKLKKHLPSYMIIATTRVKYEGQPPTCYGCSEQGHQFQECPGHKQSEIRREGRQHPLWAEVVIQGMGRTQDDGRSQMDQTPCTTTGGKVKGVETTSQQMSETQMSTLRGADEEADMDTTQADGHGQEEMGRDGDQYNMYGHE